MLATDEHRTLSLAKGFVGQRYSLSKINVQICLDKRSFCWFALAGPGNLDSRIGAQNVFIVL